jgi:hypothetical protein
LSSLAWQQSKLRRRGRWRRCASAISNRRLIACDEHGVTFKYKDYRVDGRARYKHHDPRNR